MASKSIFRFFPGGSRIEYFLLRSLAWVVNGLPVESATWLAAQIGDLLYGLLSKRRKTTLENLEKAFPGPDQAAQRNKIAREVFRSFSISLMEFFRIPAMLREASKRFVFEGTEVLDAAFAKKKGVILVISHIGSWEYLAFLPYLRGYPCSVIVRETRNPYIFKWIQDLRNQTGLHPIHRHKSVKEILRELKANHLVAILIDQWAGPSGLWMDFFGHPTSTTSIPARLAEKTGAALVPAFCLRTDTGHYKIVIRPEVPLVHAESSEERERKTTEQLNQMLEEEIRRWPGQWAWGHRRWKSLARYSAALAAEGVRPPQKHF